jgi:Spy/CpxP family protein refolding chaperone
MRFWFVLLCLVHGLGLQAAEAQMAPEKKSPESMEGRGMGPMAGPREEWSARLNLSGEQIARMRELRESYLRDTLSWRNELMAKRFELRDLLHVAEPDPVRVLAKQREISEMEARIQERSVLNQLEMRKVLTPEQMKLLPSGFGPGGYRGHRMMPGRGPGMVKE